MRRYYIVSGILLIIPIIDLAVAAPVIVQNKRQTSVDVKHIPEDAITMLGKRAGEWDELGDLFLVNWDHFAKPEESSTARPSSSSQPSGPDRGRPDVGKLPPIPEEPFTVSEADHELEANALQNPGPPIESDHESTQVHAPLSSLVFPTWFHQDHALYGMMGSHPSRPNLGPSNSRLVAEEPLSRPASPTAFDADHEHQVVHLPTDSNHEMVDMPPSDPVSSPNPNRRSMGTNSLLEDPQPIDDTLNNAKELRLISRTARDVLNAA